MDDREYETFAIAKPGQTQAGPLKVEWDSKPTKTKVTFSGDWEFPGEIAMINTRGNQEMFDVGSGWNTAFGHSRNATFMCKVSEIREVHFRMCGIQRFTISDVAADPGTQTSPKVSIEHVHPTLNGHGPVWTGKLPELQEFVDLKAQERNDSSAASPPATRPDSP